MRYGQTLLACVALSGAAYAQEEPIVVQPPPDTPVIVEPAPAEAPPPVVETAPPTVVPAPPPLTELPPTYQPAPGAPPAHVKHERHRNRWFDPRDGALIAGAGVADYVGSSMRDATETGAQWDVRYTLSHRSLIAFEAGYSGTYNKMQSPVEGRGSVAPYIINNGFDGDLRLNLLPFRVQPYIFGGLGYNHASVKNLGDSPAMAARFNGTDEQFLVPAGGGLALHLFRHGTIDTRVTYRSIFKSDLDRQNPDARLDQWVVNAHLGYAF
jgi:hypothetical protein